MQAAQRDRERDSNRHDGARVRTEACSEDTRKILNRNYNVI